MSAKPISDERLNGAIRYFLQLAIEHETDKAAYADGAEVLERVVSALEEHRSARISLHRTALIAELAEPIYERLKLEAAGAVSRAETCNTVSKWLRRKGIERSPEEVGLLLTKPLRAGAQQRTEREKLYERLASLVGVSQSQFEKIVGVVKHGTETKGRLGNPLMHERAAIDAAPTRAELLLYALHALDIDKKTGRKIAALLREEHIELMYESIDVRAYAADVLAAAKQAAESKPTPAPRKSGRRGDTE